MPPVAKFPGGAALQKELQGFAGVLSFQEECLRKGTGMTKISQERKTSEGYFGNPLDPDSVGLCNQLVEGTGLFAHMYDIEETSQQTSTHQVNSNNVTLVLKPFLHCLPDTRVVVGTQTNNINLHLLLSNKLVTPKSKSITPIKANTLFTRSQEHIKNGKKALSVVKSRKSPYNMYASTGNLPSGMTMDDYYVYVRKRMFVLLSKEPMPEGADDDTADAIEPGVNDTADAIEPGNNNNDTADAINDDDIASVATAGTTGCGSWGWNWK